MDIENYENILNKLKQISRIYNLELKFNTIITISKNNINDKRVLLILKNNTSDNIIYDNIDYINQELNLDIKLKLNNFVKSLTFDYDFKRNIIQIIEEGKERIVLDSNIKKYINDKFKAYTVKDVLNKFDFLKKYSTKNIKIFDDNEVFYVRKRSNKVMAFMHIFTDTKLLNLEGEFKDLCDIFEIKKEQVEEYFNKYSEKSIKFISFSDNLVNIYTN